MRHSLDPVRKAVENLASSTCVEVLEERMFLSAVSHRVFGNHHRADHHVPAAHVSRSVKPDDLAGSAPNGSGPIIVFTMTAVFTASNKTTQAGSLPATGQNSYPITIDTSGNVLKNLTISSVTKNGVVLPDVPAGMAVSAGILNAGGTYSATLTGDPAAKSNDKYEITLSATGAAAPLPVLTVQY